MSTLERESGRATACGADTEVCAWCGDRCRATHLCRLPRYDAATNRFQTVPVCPFCVFEAYALWTKELCSGLSDGALAAWNAWSRAHDVPFLRAVSPAEIPHAFRSVLRLGGV